MNIISKYQEVQCPLFQRRFRRGKSISILCDGKPDTHQFFSSIEKREEHISKKCDNYDECNKYQAYEQKI